MGFSLIKATGDGHTTQFSVNFSLDYLQEADVTCRVGTEVDGSGNPIYRPITFLSTNLLLVGGAAAGNGVPIVFTRTVDKTHLLIDFNNGDQLDEDNLTIAQKQVMMAVHEVLDGRVATNTQDIDAGGYTVKNLREPTADTDAATKNFVLTRSGAAASVIAEAAAAVATAQAVIATNQAAIAVTGGNTSTAQAAIATTQAGIATTKASASAASAAAAAQSAIDALIASGGLGFANLRGYISGLTLSPNVGTPNTILDIASGVATDVNVASSMVVTTAYSKTTGAWALGGASVGALDTGTIAANTTYHVFIIQRPDTGDKDYLFSLSPTTPTMPTSYTRKRRIGSFLTNASSQIIPFVQIGNYFYLKTPVLDLSSVALNSTPTYATLSIPLGVSVRPILNFTVSASGSTCRVRIYSPLLPDNNSATNMLAGSAISGGTSVTTWGQISSVFSNSTRQVRYCNFNSDAGNSISMTTEGWIDSL